ncbi:hypothetical protein FD755_005231 [Muntiacus reevesi]|uniref:Centrosomal protein C10orf90 N-terminal domain-containing protein n=1 Tax=Muntiacus reevesi TaxID=9886 RepID=A0A5J5MSX9_MUNRE|nr:hypothetical protein FD755_005231 [Muntiacus reevesi]
MPSNQLILCHLPHLLPTIFPSIRVFSNKSTLCIWWPKYWRFNFSTSPSNEYSALISFRIDWFNLPAVQGSLLQCHSSKACFLRSLHSCHQHSSWERLRDSQYSPHDQIALKNLQSDVPERRSDFTEGTLASQNTKMISSIVISQLIDENKSKENGAALSVPCACPMKPSLANHSRVTINRALEFLPGGLGIQTPAGEPGLKTKPPPKEEKPCSGSQKGFASITITARRVGAPASTLVWEAVGDPLCVKCRARDALLGDPSALAGRADPSQQHGPLTCTEFSRNSCVMGLKVPEAHEQLCEGHGYWITSVDRGEDHFSPGTSLSRAGKSPLLFSSCVHLRVSQSCPNPVYCLDRSLSVPVEPPQLAGPKTHRSVLSLNLSCNSHRLTPDGGDDTEIREPRRGALKPALREGDQDLLGPRWNLGLQGSFLKENPSLGQVRFGNLGTGRCPWRGSPPSENAEVGTNQITMRKRKEDEATHCPTRGHDQAHQLSIHIPGWSYTADGASVNYERSSHKRVSISSSRPYVMSRKLAPSEVHLGPCHSRAGWEEPRAIHSQMSYPSALNICMSGSVQASECSDLPQNRSNPDEAGVECLRGSKLPGPALPFEEGEAHGGQITFLDLLWLHMLLWYSYFIGEVWFTCGSSEESDSLYLKDSKIPNEQKITKIRENEMLSSALLNNVPRPTWPGGARAEFSPVLLARNARRQLCFFLK